MKCSRCLKDFPENLIHESHDVPCYLFYKEIGRNAKKNLADKYTRRWLCKECHNLYEETLNLLLIKTADDFGKGWDNGDSKSN